MHASPEEDPALWDLASPVQHKFWIHVDKEEQIRRFESRANDRLRSWKLTDEDWRNREKWDLYEAAVEEMLRKTSTLTAPWTIVEGTDKLWALVKVLRTVVDRLCQELDHVPDILGGEPAKAHKTKRSSAAARPQHEMVEDKKAVEEDKILSKGGEDKKQKAEKGK